MLVVAATHRPFQMSTDPVADVAAAGTSGLWTLLVLVLVAGAWVAMWQVFLRHIPVLANLKAEKVQVSLGDSNSSALITLPDDDTFKYVVMPMRI